MIQHDLINLHPNKYGQGLRYYSFSVSLDRCMGNCNTLNDLSNVFNMITGISESKTLTKHISYKCECKFESGKCNYYDKLLLMLES